MSKSATSVGVFGVYLAGTAATLIVAPNMLLGMLKIEPTTDPWIRVLGVVVATLAGYYIAAARAENVQFFRMTVWARVGVLAGFAGLIACGLAPTQIIGFGAIDAVGALWTWSALRQA